MQRENSKNHAKGKLGKRLALSGDWLGLANSTTHTRRRKAPRRFYKDLSGDVVVYLVEVNYEDCCITRNFDFDNGAFASRGVQGLAGRRQVRQSGQGRQ